MVGLCTMEMGLPSAPSVVLGAVLRLEAGFNRLWRNVQNGQLLKHSVENLQSIRSAKQENSINWYSEHAQLKDGENLDFLECDILHAPILGGSEYDFDDIQSLLVEVSSLFGVALASQYHRHCFVRICDSGMAFSIHWFICDHRFRI